MKKYLQTVFTGQSRKYIGATALLTAAGSASAAVPADVTTNLQTLATDVAAVGSLVLIAIVAAVAFKYLRRAL